MSGHSKWATIKRSKGAADAKRGSVFTKLSKNISIAAKKGKDPEMNYALRTAIEAARAANMPKDVIERAVLRGAGELPGQQIEELVYEGYGPAGVALLIQCATDNTNRTLINIKSVLNKFGGRLGGPGSVAYLFKQRGLVRLARADEVLQLKAVDAGAEDIVEEDGGLTVYTAPANLAAVKQTLGEAVEFAELTLLPETSVTLATADQERVTNLLSALEENDDVIDITHNASL